ncbi:type 2A phosphatase activator Tip41p [[Candida] railenensis]|uniref:Type 2A phosphatase activator Tip41p n=1 Tax=[Candida] railenensis TaxID=45579 RepID=A0A9P0QU98_9ASCO|nr:type 2A phosphatase activator Tip41p [[Candida] railenensis]
MSTEGDKKIEKSPRKVPGGGPVGVGTRRPPIGASGPGINAVHVNAARDMVKIHTQGRQPPVQVKVPHSVPVSVPPSGSTRPSGSTSSRFQVPAPRTPPVVSVPAKANHDNDECRNPQCPHCGSVIIPSPKSSYPIQDKPSITVNDWSIFVIKKPICNAVELDNLAETKFSFPLPEMIFGNNSIRIANEKEGTLIEFNTIDALEGLQEGCDFKVSYHKEWLKSRRTETEKGAGGSHEAAETSNTTSGSSGSSPLPSNTTKDLTRLTDLESLKPYDWTYSTNYKGSITHPEPGYLKATETTKIPIHRLTRPDPILFFDEMVLFEDELGDNGISMLTVKIRVMPTCLLLLSRFFLRIDNVAFRVRDTRIFIDLETSHIVREYKEQESTYESTLQKVTGGSSKTSDPKGLLRDTNWVSQNIPVLKVETETNREIE